MRPPDHDAPREPEDESTSNRGGLGISVVAWLTPKSRDRCGSSPQASTTGSSSTGHLGGAKSVNSP
ncbi:hypothetical protein FOMA001_g20166 [Fusarium oxysporum f. sp. matthiolae]|nr:hypothetical protein FOMA001_g20245 [Fusarium oxysporum f. sp. matthiolae]KAH7459224.1 hypothetical protein FOMA001_g20166 [Fusarium oxysporum f. sp. matthiolae]